MAGYYAIDINERIRKECMRRRYSFRTIKTYQKCVERFLRKIRKTIDKISKTDVRDFLNYLSDEGYSGSSINVYHMAIKFLMEECLNKKMKINIRYSKTPKRMPVVLSKEEVRRLFEAIGNEKQRLMIELMYSSGLRVSELVNLKVKDLEIDRGYGFVRQGKGNKDRIFILAEKLKWKIERLIERENLRARDYLFRSRRERKYNIRTIGVIVKNACVRAKIEKMAHPHTLRHSFATHLIENGYDVSQVQGLLGHKSPETTMVYVHMASPNMINVRSPIECL